MNKQLLINTASALMVGDKGLLAIYESNDTCNKRFAQAGIPQTETARRGGQLIATTLLQSVPAAVAGIAFLSGGQSGELASAHLNARHIRHESKLPWPTSYTVTHIHQGKLFQTNKVI